MEPYCNMNSSNGRNCRNGMNPGNRAGAMTQQGPRNGRQFQNNNMQRRMMQDNAGRSMEVECICKASPKKNCHQNDPMTQLGNQFPPVMAYVPWQQWGEMYEAEYGLMQGTIFKDLNLIFCGVRC